MSRLKAPSPSLMLLNHGGFRGALPLRAGLALPRGWVHAAQPVLLKRNREVLVADFRGTAKWPDGSWKWILVECVLEVGGGSKEELFLEKNVDGHPILEDFGLHGRYPFDPRSTDRGRTIARGLSHMPELMPGVEMHFRLQDAGGRRDWRSRWRLLGDDSGRVRTRRFFQAQYRSRKSLLQCFIEATLYGESLLRLDWTLHNPAAARHTGGLWDMGDPSALLFKDASLTLRPNFNFDRAALWRGEKAEEVPLIYASDAGFTLLQASSGGENWQSLAHRDATGKVPLQWRGYRLRTVQGERTGLRCQPTATLIGKKRMFALSLQDWWQSFPKCLETDDEGLRLALLPRESETVHELSPGEQKTHTLYASLGPDTGTNPLAWLREPPALVMDPDYLAEIGALPHLAPSSRSTDRRLVKALKEALEGENSFFRKRERADEFGWRHFGDIYADHEEVHYDGPKPLASHFNNQYDGVLAFLHQLARTMDPRWFALADSLARHVADIDIYHTLMDKPAYNGGLFWHTDHYADAGTSGHRCYSRLHPRVAAGQPYGGGPSNEHNYAAGLLVHHYMTGDQRSARAVLSLADWVVHMDDGRNSVLGGIDSGPTGLASASASPDYHGPGRGAGNSISVLVDGHQLSGRRAYLSKAEELIRRCIHPAHDPQALGFEDIEVRWSYLAFLQALGKYLDHKHLMGEHDEAFSYARLCLLHYADWMARFERPYKENLDKVVYPTETWPAHDLRKSNIFDHAAFYAGEEAKRRVYLEKAGFFHDRALDDVMSFSTWSYARPMILLLSFGHMRESFLEKEHLPPLDTWTSLPHPTFPEEPKGFLSQRARVREALKTPRGVAKAGLTVLNLSVWKRLLKRQLW